MELLGIIMIVIYVCTVFIAMCIVFSKREIPTIAGVYKAGYGIDTIKVTVIKADRKIVKYQFRDIDDYNKIKEGSMKTSEFNQLFKYIYTDYKLLVYKINKCGK